MLKFLSHKYKKCYKKLILSKNIVNHGIKLKICLAQNFEIIRRKP